MKKVVLMLVAATLALGTVFVSSDSVDARPLYKTQWEKKYLTEGSEMGKVFPDGKANCNVCHVGVKEKKNRNDYGKSLAKLISKEEKDAAKVVEAFEKAEKEKSGEKTFGDLIKAGKLPLTKDEP